MLLVGKREWMGISLGQSPIKTSLASIHQGICSFHFAASVVREVCWWLNFVIIILGRAWECPGWMCRGREARHADLISELDIGNSEIDNERSDEHRDRT